MAAWAEGVSVVGAIEGTAAEGGPFERTLETTFGEEVGATGNAAAGVVVAVALELELEGVPLLVLAADAGPASSDAEDTGPAIAFGVYRKATSPGV